MKNLTSALTWAAAAVRSPGYCGLWLGPVLALACAGSPPPEPAAPPVAAAAVAAPAAPLDPAALVAAPDRTDKDKEADARRHPVELLQFLKIQPGSRVADLGAGGGYTTELLVRAVGPEGVVYAQNNKMTLEKFVKGAWTERLQREVNHKVVRMDQEYETPFTPEAKDLDLVTLMFSYHDVIAQGGDRAKMNAAVFTALKPGGFYVIADHRAADGSGLAAADSVHRIEPALVQKEVEAAGFKLAESADFLKDPKDELKEPSYKVGFNTDRFLFKFVKP
jgi:predicted methyltransferase